MKGTSKELLHAPFRGLGVWGLGFRVYHKPMEAVELRIFQMSGFHCQGFAACLPETGA